MAKKRKIAKVIKPTKVHSSDSLEARIKASKVKLDEYINRIIEARKTDIVHVFDAEREVMEIRANTRLNSAKKDELLAAARAKLKAAKIAAKKSRQMIKDTVTEAIDENLYDLRVCFSYQQAKYSKYLDELNKLRRDGDNKVIALRSEIQDIILNKQIAKEEKRKLIKSNLKELKKAKHNARVNRKEVNFILREVMKLSKFDSQQYMRLVKANNRYDNDISHHAYQSMSETIKDMHRKRVLDLKNKGKDKKTLAIDLKAENIAYSSRMNEAKVARNEALARSRDLRYNSFMNRYAYTSQLKNGKHPIGEWARFKFENYIAHFNLYNWLIKNAIYVLIILVFAILVIYTGGGLLSGESILTALVQISPKIFFALGVGGLILLGGTDLSIGRLTGVGVSFTLMILATTPYPDNNGVIWFNLANANPALKVIVALLISIIFCTAFTTFAGFFTAKFKMHPFISTLAVQLISYGLFQLFWSATSSFTPDENIIKALRGPQAILLVVYAIIAIVVVWFIWNKTKFGKHIYAVGGNQEAATVSGISPLKITILAFVMAGILYGFGGFIQAIQTGTGNFNSGYGTETDAIAACVIGGISFSGGVGKVSGAVIGAIILGFLTHAFGYIGVDSNLQLLIKGVIILIAVALDCVKYLRKK